MPSFGLLFMLAATCAVEAMPECTRPGFWTDISSPACAVLYEEDYCQGHSEELLAGSGTNGTARSAAIRPGCYLYGGNKDLGFGIAYGPIEGTSYLGGDAWTRKHYWTSNDSQSHEVSCRCFTNNADALSCTPSEEWVLIATHDNRKYSVASLFEYKYTMEYVVGLNGMVDGTRNQQFHDVVDFHSLKTVNRAWNGPFVDKILVPAKSCAFVLQEAYKCDNFFYVRSKVEVRLQDSASTNGGTQPCNLDYASAVPADVLNDG